ncbi:MAG: prepilin-type cleavage/methylation domain-containing protein, partial [Deltaproteobacteria bacterium]
VEIAIVLVIIGLILGGILKGQSMIENAKIKRVKSDIDSIVAAVYGYQDKYNYLPGDDPKNQFGLGPVGNGDGLLTTSDEQTMAWRDLIAGGFISGDANQTSEALVAKVNPFGGKYLFRYRGATGENYIFVDNIPLDAARTLDEKYDDGQYNSGDIQANSDYTTTGVRDMYWYVF